MANSIFTRGESQTFGEHLPMTRPLKEALNFRDVVVVIRAVEIEGEILGEPGKSTCQWIGWKICRKAPYFMGKSMVSCKFSLKPIQSKCPAIQWLGSDLRS